MIVHGGFYEFIVLAHDAKRKMLHVKHPAAAVACSAHGLLSGASGLLYSLIVEHYPTCC